MNFPNALDEEGKAVMFCSEEPELFFPDEDLIYNTTKEARSTDPQIRLEEREKLQTAKALCNSCGYNTQCLLMSFQIQSQDPDHLHPHGVWGGFSRKERAAIHTRNGGRLKS